MKNVVKVGLIGFGTVGSGVAKIMTSSEKPHLRGRNFGLELVKIADLDITSDRGIALPEDILTTDVDEIINNPEIDIVIELIGGFEHAKSFTLKAFEKGKSVVTANKALVAKHGKELFEAASKGNVSYMFEAAVGGGIPIIRALVDGLNANNIQSMYGILNGTTNYILTGMARDGSDYNDVLAKAQKLGYAEADPTSDVSGSDALNKIAILAKLAYGADIDIGNVFCEGIETIVIKDIEYAWELGYTIKLLAIAKKHEDGRVEVRVHPTLVQAESIMAYVEDEFNAVEIYGDAVGRQVFYGKGAGTFPTSSAVVSDIVSIASGIITDAPTNVSRIIANKSETDLIDISELKLPYYLRFMVKDQPGVLAMISKILADQQISIESVIQMGNSDIDHVPLVIMTHEAMEGDMQKAMKQFEELDIVSDKVQLIRVEDI
ncbi:homoserine dehydrogenase [Candidatus Latescibacterota bacterium]